MPDAKLSPVSEQPIFGVKYTRTAIVAAAIVTIIVLCSVAYSPPLGLKLKEGILQQLGSTFGFLLMVSLFVERAVEVVISIWSDPEADRLEQELETLAEARSRQSDRIDHLLTERAQNPAPSPERLTAISKELEVLREKMRDEQDRDDAIDRELVKYSAHTRKVAAWIGLAIGVLTAGVGFRVLHTLFVEPPPVGWRVHNGFFTLVDVLLTGALLSGGSKAVHHVFNVYESFMEATTKKAEAAKASAGK
jgi:hypothetical protein